MKLAISNISWSSEENETVISLLKTYGITGIEIAPTLLFEKPTQQTDRAIKKVRHFWECHGIKIIAMQSLLFGQPGLNLFGEISKRKEMLEYLKRIVELAGKIGAQKLVFGSPKNRKIGDLSKEDALDIAADFFSDIAEVAMQNDACICIEPNAPDYGCDFVTNVEQAIELIELVNHNGFGLHIDAGVMALNGEPYGDTLEVALPHIRHFHISEPFLNKITDDKTNHKELGQQLKRLNYQDWVSIEMRNGQGFSNLSVIDKSLQFAIVNYIK